MALSYLCIGYVLSFQVIIQRGVFETSDRLSLLRLQQRRRTVEAPLQLYNHILLHHIIIPQNTAFCQNYEIQSETTHNRL
jgi:hypothetical protein